MFLSKTEMIIPFLFGSFWSRADIERFASRVPHASIFLLVYHRLFYLLHGRVDAPLRFNHSLAYSMSGRMSVEF
jgi:hypothetical protein